MTGELNNPAPAGTDNATPSETDNPETWDDFDPEEDNEAVTEDEGTEDEVMEEASEEADEEENSETGPDEDNSESDDDEQAPALVTLNDGKQVTHDELVAGYMRQSDHTRKSQENANERRALEANAERIERINAAFVDHIASMIPDEPDAALAYTDPAGFVAAKAQYDSAISQVQKLIEIGNAPKEMRNDLSGEQHQRLIAEENRKLALAIPSTGTDEGRAKFFKSITPAAEAAGFSAGEIASGIDSRLFVLADLARKGLAAEQNTAKAKAKAKKAPPATPRKPGQSDQQSAARKRDAMKSLAMDDSIENAVRVANL